MRSKKEDFLRYVAQTSVHPAGLEIAHAKESCLYTADGRKYLDFISGIGVNNLGFAHPAIVKAIKAQAEKYLHVMVYGEYVQTPQVELAKKLVSLLPEPLNQVYFTNSGTEANEGALKLAKKYTGRKKIVSFEGSFHGDTHGACSVTGREIYRKPFEPLLPGISFLPFNSIEALTAIDKDVAAVITEPIQGEGGMRIPDDGFLKALRARCDEVGALLIFDEVQTGFGRTGKCFAMEHWGVAPDILTLAKALGGGMPLGAFAAPREVMATLSENPPLSHVTTFGGHPVSCAAGLAALEVMLKESLVQKAALDGAWLLARLQRLARKDCGVREARGKGLMIGLELESAALTQSLVQSALELSVILGWTLHTDRVIRIMPPLTIPKAALDEGLGVIENILRSARPK